MADREQWLKERRTGIGGSDAAAILGVSRYATPYTVWADKLGLLPEKEDTESMRQGRDLEEYVAQRFYEQTGKKVRRENRTLRNPLYPYSLAHIDRRIINERAGLECKTCSPYRTDEFGDGQFPIEYYAQCLHYLAVTGWDTWYLAILIFGQSFTVYEIRREAVQNEIDDVQAAIYAFWENYILTGTPPDGDGLKATTDAINEVNKDSCPTCIDLSYMENRFIEIARLNAEIDERSKLREAHKQDIKIAMGDNEYASYGMWEVTWKPRKDGVRVFTIKTSERG